MNSSYTNILDDPNFNIETLLQMINDEIGPQAAAQVENIVLQAQNNSPPGSPTINASANAPSPGSHKGGRKTKRKIKKRKRKTKKRRKKRSKRR